jgi:RNA polymerase sigma factor (sigma-70 family)
MLNRITVRDSIILGHYGLPFAVLKSLRRRFYTVRLLDADDAIQTGMLALIRAAENFDGLREVTFGHYAWVIIRRAMLEAAGRDSLIRMPRFSTNRPSRTQFPVTLSNVCETKNNEEIDFEKWLPRVQALADQLESDDRRLCYEAFGLCGHTRKTLSEIARDTGCTRQNISLQLKKIIAWLRSQMLDCLPPGLDSQEKGMGYIRLRPRRKPRCTIGRPRYSEASCA